LSPLAELIKETIFQFEAAFIIGPISLYKILVRIGLVKLNHLYFVVIFTSYGQIGQALGKKCLTDARRTLKNNVFL